MKATPPPAGTASYRASGHVEDRQADEDSIEFRHGSPPRQELTRLGPALPVVAAEPGVATIDLFLRHLLDRPAQHGEMRGFGRLFEVEGDRCRLGRRLAEREDAMRLNQEPQDRRPAALTTASPVSTSPGVA